MSGAKEGGGGSPAYHLPHPHPPQHAQYVGPYRLEKTLGKGQTGEPGRSGRGAEGGTRVLTGRAGCPDPWVPRREGTWVPCVSLVWSPPPASFNPRIRVPRMEVEVSDLGSRERAGAQARARRGWGPGWRGPRPGGAAPGAEALGAVRPPAGAAPAVRPRGRFPPRRAPAPGPWRPGGRPGRRGLQHPPLFQAAGLVGSGLREGDGSGWGEGGRDRPPAAAVEGRILPDRYPWRQTRPPSCCTPESQGWVQGSGRPGPEVAVEEGRPQVLVKRVGRH